MFIETIIPAIIRHGIPTCGTIAYTDFLAVVLTPAVVSILTSLFSIRSIGGKLLDKILLNTADGHGQRLSMLGGVALFVCHGLLIMENLNTVHICEVFNGFGISAVVELHHEVYAVAVGPAAETVVGVTAGTDNERTCFFIVERA